MGICLVALTAVAIPGGTVYAQDENPPQPGTFSNERLEFAWKRQVRAYERLGKVFDGVDARLEKIQELIDRAANNGKDVSSLQTALDEYQAALKSARPIYESAKGTINSHQGFDAEGKVTDPQKAKGTIEELRSKMQDLKNAMDGSFKKLVEAIKIFRQQNSPAVESQSPRDT